MGVSTARHNGAVNTAGVIASELAVAQAELEPAAIVAADEPLNKADAEKSSNEVQIHEEAIDAAMDLLQAKIQELANALQQPQVNDGNQARSAPGTIRYVHPGTKRVLINLGTADHIKPHTSFMIYGQSPGEPKQQHGVIEIVRLVGDHLAEAYIIQEDLKHPIAVGDASELVAKAATAPESETKKSVVEVLNEPTKVEADGVPLRDVLKQLGDLHKIPIRLDGIRIGGDGLSKSPDQRVHFSAQDATLKDVLHVLLEPLALDYVIETDGLRITSAAAAKQVHGGKHTSRVINRSHAGESIAIVGDVDLDGDGKSDRQMFYNLLQEAGIKLADIVNDEGKRSGEKLSKETNFLVVGDIPTLHRIGDRKQREQAQKIVDHFKELRKEARLSGVRIVTLNDFLDYIGQPKSHSIPDPETPRPRDFRQPNAIEVRIEAALEEQTEVSFVDTSLKDALEYVEDLHNIDIIIKESEITEDGGSADQRVNLELSGVTLNSALDLMLQPLGLDYLIDKEVLLITTTTNAAEHRELRVYNLYDFKSMFGEIKFDEEAATQKVTKAIQKAVDGKWETENGDGGTMSLTPAGLVVRQNQRTHREIENLIEQLRRAEEAK